MDRQELTGKLATFKKVCADNGYIEDKIDLEEAYPGMIPTSFIVNVLAKKEWLDRVYGGQALKQLIKVLWDTTDAQTRENIHTISIYGEEERHPTELQ